MDFSGRTAAEGGETKEKKNGILLTEVTSLHQVPPKDKEMRKKGLDPLPWYPEKVTVYETGGLAKKRSDYRREAGHLFTKARKGAVSRLQKGGFRGRGLRKVGGVVPLLLMKAKGHRC